MATHEELPAKNLEREATPIGSMKLQRNNPYRCDMAPESHEESIQELQDLKSRGFSSATRVTITSMSENMEKMKGVDKEGSDYGAYEFETLQLEQVLLQKLRTEDRYKDVLFKFRLLMTDGILVRYRRHLKEDADELRGTIHELLLGGSNIRQTPKGNEWEINEDEAQKNDRVTKEFFLSRSTRDIQAALRLEHDTLTVYQENLRLLEARTIKIGTVMNYLRFNELSPRMKTEILLSENPDKPATHLKDLIKTLASMSRMCPTYAEEQILQYPEKQEMDDDIAISNLLQLGTFIANDRQWISEDNLPPHLATEKTALLEAIDICQTRYFSSLKEDKRHHLTGVLTSLSVWSSNEQDERVKEWKRREEMRGVCNLTAKEIAQYQERAERLGDDQRTWELWSSRTELVEFGKRKWDTREDAGDVEMDLRRRVVRFKREFERLGS